MRPSLRKEIEPKICPPTKGLVGGELRRNCGRVRNSQESDEFADMERITFNKSVSGAVLHAWATEFNRAHREAPNSASRSLRFVALFTFAVLVFLAGRAFAETNADAPTGKPDAVIDLATKEGVDFVKGQWRYSDTKIIGNTWRTDDVLNMLDKMNAIEEVIAVGILPHDRMNE